MTTIILGAILALIRAFLGVVLLAAGGAKLADTRTFAATLANLGVPARPTSLRGILALAIPLGEILLGLAVACQRLPLLADAAALVLFAAFTGVIIEVLRAKPGVACRCFGSLSDSQFGWAGAVRGVLLTCLAALMLLADLAGVTDKSTVSGLTAILIVLGYLLFAYAAAQAARTLAAFAA